MSGDTKKPSPGQWWAETRHCANVVFIVGYDDHGGVVYQKENGKFDSSCMPNAWELWHHAPRCTGFGGVAAVENFPKWYVTRLHNRHYYRVDSLNEGVYVEGDHIEPISKFDIAGFMSGDSTWVEVAEAEALARLNPPAGAVDPAVYDPATFTSDWGPHEPMVAVQVASACAVTNAMVDRFLTWRLPQDFMPDGGVSFNKPSHDSSWPVGTNLLTATQARQMLEHVMSGSPVAAESPDERNLTPFPDKFAAMTAAIRVSKETDKAPEFPKYYIHKRPDILWYATISSEGSPAQITRPDGTTKGYGSPYDQAKWIAIGDWLECTEAEGKARIAPSVNKLPVRLWCSPSVAGMHASVGVFARRDFNKDSVEIKTPGGFYIEVPQ